jgi:hypothetical protein
MRGCFLDQPEKYNFPLMLNNQKIPLPVFVYHYLVTITIHKKVQIKSTKRANRLSDQNGVWSETITLTTHMIRLGNICQCKLAYSRTLIFSCLTTSQSERQGMNDHITGGSYNV